MIARITSTISLINAVHNQRRANPLFSGAIEQRAALSFGTFLFAAEKKSTLAPDRIHGREIPTSKFIIPLIRQAEMKNTTIFSTTHPICKKIYGNIYRM